VLPKASEIRIGRLILTEWKGVLRLRISLTTISPSPTTRRKLEFSDRGRLMNFFRKSVSCSPDTVVRSRRYLQGRVVEIQACCSRKLKATRMDPMVDRSPSVVPISFEVYRSWHYEKRKSTGGPHTNDQLDRDRSGLLVHFSQSGFGSTSLGPQASINI